MLFNSKGEKIYYSNAIFNNKILSISMIGETVKTSSFTALHKISGNKEIDKYTFEYVYGGKGYIETKKKVYTVKKGNVFILNNNTNHYYYSDKESPIEKYFIVCSGKLVDSLISVYGIKDGTVIKEENFGTDFKNLINATTSAPETVNDIAAALILKILQHVSEINQGSEAATSSNTPIHRLIYGYIYENTNLPLTVDDLCACFNLSTSTLIRLIKKHFGTTPKQLILSAKIHEAKSLLTTTNLSISDISNQLSFSYQNNFSATFSHIVGCSPSEYREANPYKVDTLEKLPEPQ